MHPQNTLTLLDSTRHTLIALLVKNGSDPYGPIRFDALDSLLAVLREANTRWLQYWRRQTRRSQHAQAETGAFVARSALEIALDLLDATLGGPRVRLQSDAFALQFQCQRSRGGMTVAVWFGDAACAEQAAQLPVLGALGWQEQFDRGSLVLSLERPLNSLADLLDMALRVTLTVMQVSTALESAQIAA